ncbi:unnamed protein product [Meganyctiphanes norvegica]|uniref:Pectinesterase inhibitor domain-containing protein n=1 Tax=Meganyctiphanes norvegica TaxID=48144 RepID=A0AAV2R1I9_MEGNR
MAAVSTRVNPLLALVSLLALLQLLVPLVEANWREVPVHHGGALDHRDKMEQRQGYAPYAVPQHGAQVARQSYGGYQQQEEDSSDLLTYILPALAITGLSLLFPSIVTINSSKRRRRDASGDLEPIEPMDALLGHLSTIYYAATESDICMQRIVCELGATTKDLKQGNKDLMISILGKAASKKYSKLFSKFSYGVNTANCKKIGCKLID